MRALLKRLRHHLVVLLAVLGPGFVIAHGNSDAGGLFTYTQAGARWGYLPLWTMLPLAVVLLVALEMAARLGAVTHKGLSDLIREEFGLRATFLVMAVLAAVNVANLGAELAGVAICLQMYGISPRLTVPAATLLIWLLVVGRRSGLAEKLFLLGA
jgi:Mn2+/Fe2+ NRAMP family transporter